MQPEETSITERLLGWIDYAALGIEILAVAVIAGWVLYATVVYALTRFGDRAAGRRVYGLYRQRLGQALLVGLELLVAADIIRTVALDSTFQSIGLLGMLVLIRTFLSWSLEVEIDGRWPWQGGADKNATEPSEAAP
jgi:uncharacterized membrane protein